MSWSAGRARRQFADWRPGAFHSRPQSGSGTELVVLGVNALTRWFVPGRGEFVPAWSITTNHPYHRERIV